MIAPVIDACRTAYGVTRSLAIYHGRPSRLRRLETFYRDFIEPGDLCFDIGAHAGNRIRAWRRLGARVVAVEPQPSMMRILRWIYGRDSAVTLVEAAVGAQPGSVTLNLNLENPTVATLSGSFIEQANRMPSFRGQRWTRRVQVQALTLKQLIDRHGEPRFLKIDVEGWEAQVLETLAHPPFAISFEFVPMARNVAALCIEHLVALAPYHFNASFGDSMELVHQRPLDPKAILAWLESLEADGPAGDVYACIDENTLTF